MRHRTLTFLLATVVFAAVSTMVGGVADASSARKETAQARDDDIDSDISSALRVVNRFWATHWPSLFNGRYSRPTVYGGYSYGGRKPPMCDGKRVGYDNAHYCWSRDMISWDVAYMKDGYRVADVWVYQVIAHEWGHAVQNRLDDSLIWRARELQADCLAGAALYGAARDGTLLFESGDVEELEVVFRKLGDTKPWRKPGDHGSASERVSAFERGARGGVGGCMPD